MSTLDRSTIVRGLTRRQALASIGAAGVAAASLPRSARAQQGGASALAAAPQADAPAANPGVYRFMVGELECFSIADAGMPGGPSAYPAFGQNASKDEVDALTRANFIDQGYSYFNILAVKAKDRLVLVDTGFGSIAGPSGGWLDRGLRQAGLSADAVTDVVLTHLHVDHVGGIASATGTPYPKARVLVSEPEHAFWSAASPDLGKMGVEPPMRTQLTDLAKATLAKVGDRLERVKDGAEVAPGLKLRLAAGHTPGHQMVEVTSGNERLLMIADAVHHFAISFQRPQWHVAFDTDPDAGAATRRKVLAECAADRLRVMAYHTPWPGLGRVSSRGDAFAWEPEPWRW